MEKYYGITRAAPYQKQTPRLPAAQGRASFNSNGTRFNDQQSSVVPQQSNGSRFGNQPYGLIGNANSNYQLGNMNSFNQNIKRENNNFGGQLQYNNDNTSIEEPMNYDNYYGDVPNQSMSMIVVPVENQSNQVPSQLYGQLNMFRFNPRESKVFGNNQSNFSTSPRAEISVNTVQSVKPQKEHPVAQGGKLAETPSGGSLYVGQASVQSQNGHMQVRDNTIATMGKFFGSTMRGSSGSETLNKRYSSDNASNKLGVDKQKKICTFGMRIFTGTVEKVSKWYKTPLDIDIDCIFEVIGKCLNVRDGQGCEKFILIRDSSGPVLQIIYYEIDYLLPEINVGTIVRVVGKMIGKNRMKGYKVRQCYDSEIKALPRMCAIGHNVITQLQAANLHRQ